MFGRKHSVETRLKMSKDRVGFKHTDEFREKCRRNAIGNKGNTGKVFTEEHRLKISKALTGNKNGLGWNPTPAHCEKIRQRLIGRKLSDETKQKISMAKLSNRNKSDYTEPGSLADSAGQVG